MDTKRIVLWVVLAILAIVVIYIAFFKGSGIGQSAVSSAGQMVGGC